LVDAHILRRGDLYYGKLHIIEREHIRSSRPNPPLQPDRFAREIVAFSKVSYSALAAAERQSVGRTINLMA